MAGRIKLGVWLPFTAEWEGDGRSFAWRARIGWGPLTIFRAVDRFADGAGSMDVRLFGRLPMVQASDEDTARSGAGRELIVANWDVPPERPEVRLQIDRQGAVRSGQVLRWDPFFEAEILAAGGVGQ